MFRRVVEKVWRQRRSGLEEVRQNKVRRSVVVQKDKAQLHTLSIEVTFDLPATVWAVVYTKI